VLLMRRAVAPLERSISSWKTIVSARRAYERVKRRLEGAEKIEHRVHLWVPAGNVSVRSLSYYPSGSSSAILRRVSFGLESGDALGVVGSSGAGKSTLAALLLGNIEPSSGHVRLDGIDVHLWDRAHLGPHIGFLPQNVELFAGTVRENIARMGEGDPDAVVAAAKLAGIHDMIIRLSKGYDTEVGDDGAILSGGQRQRIALARAVYGSPKLIVLDEPDANLDREGQAALGEAIVQLRSQDTTIVLITHRPEMLQHTSKILMLARGSAEISRNDDTAALPSTGSLPAIKVTEEVQHRD
ncbi:MAG: ATP-binding cassette domain-containing protein, partial [Geminicoccaceae bacterium]